MSAPTRLVALRCLRCDTHVPAQPEEVAWVCSQCGQGLLLDESQGLAALEINYLADLSPDARGKPFWVAEGRVILARQTYGVGLGKKTAEAERFWAQGRQFLIPAYACPLDDLLILGVQWLEKPLELRGGAPVAFEPVTLSPADLHALGEFIVLAVEAGRADNLRTVEFSLNLGTPAMWILP